MPFSPGNASKQHRWSVDTKFTSSTKCSVWKTRLHGVSLTLVSSSLLDSRMTVPWRCWWTSLMKSETVFRPLDFVGTPILPFISLSVVSEWLDKHPDWLCAPWFNNRSVDLSIRISDVWIQAVQFRICPFIRDVEGFLKFCDISIWCVCRKHGSGITPGNRGIRSLGVALKEFCSVSVFISRWRSKLINVHKALTSPGLGDSMYWFETVRTLTDWQHLLGGKPILSKTAWFICWGIGFMHQ